MQGPSFLFLSDIVNRSDIYGDTAFVVNQQEDKRTVKFNCLIGFFKLFDAFFNDF